MYQRDASRALHVIGYMWHFTGMRHIWCVKITCDEWCMNVDEWMMSVDAWMLMNEWWLSIMNEWWMLMNEWWVFMHECCWMNDGCWWWMNDGWINGAGWWMNDERIWMLMHFDECVMYVEWCMMHWWIHAVLCIDVWWISLCVKCMYISGNDDCILYWCCNCFDILILIFVFCLYFRVMIIMLYLQ